MKTVSGEVISSEPVSLSKAARILSNFVSLDSNGASPAYIAYLRRASASFEELAQLHKEHKKSGSHSKVKKQRLRSDAADREGTAESVKKYSKVGVIDKELQGVDKSEGEGISVDVSLNVDEETRKQKSKNRRDEDEGRSKAVSMEVQKVEGVVDWNVGDVGGTGKNLKKKKENNEIAAVIVEDLPYGDHDSVDASELKNGAETFNGSMEKEEKKRAKHDVDADIVMQEQSNHQSQNEGNETGIIQGDKQKKNKKNQPHGDHDAAVNTIEVKNETESFDGSKERRKKKKNDNPGKEKGDDLVDIKKEMQSRPTSQDGVNEEATQLVKNKESRKRKHESVASVELEGSQEKHQSKKKKR